MASTLSTAEHSSSSSGGGGDRSVRYTPCIARSAEQTDDEELEQINIGIDGSRGHADETSSPLSRSRSRSRSRDNNTTDGDQSETELTSLVNGPVQSSAALTMLPMHPVSSTSGMTSSVINRHRMSACQADEDACQRQRLISSPANIELQRKVSVTSTGVDSALTGSSGGAGGLSRPPGRVPSSLGRMQSTDVAGTDAVTSPTNSEWKAKYQQQHHQKSSVQTHPIPRHQQPSVNSIMRNLLAGGNMVTGANPPPFSATGDQRTRRPTGQSVRSSLTVAGAALRSSDAIIGYINRGHTIEPTTPRHVRRQRRKEIARTFGNVSKRVLPGTGVWKPPGQDGVAGNATAAGAGDNSTTSGSDKGSCHWSLVFDPAGRLAYWWSFVVSIAFIYNFWVLIYRSAFHEIDPDNMAVWFALDYIADLLYALDIAFNFRTGYLDDGVLQTDSTKLRIHYMNSTIFYVDCLCLLPLDFLYLSIGFASILRCFRLVKIYRFWAFLDRTERHTNFPNVVRTVTLLHYLFAIYHWNACLMHIVTRNFESSNENWKPQLSSSTVATTPSTPFPTPVGKTAGPNLTGSSKDVFANYLHFLYFSTQTLTTIGGLPKPQSKEEYMFVIMEFVLGLLLFATILGHVANIVTSISAARKEFQAKLDCVKTYMILRRVPLRLQDRVIKWFDYLWLSKKSSDEDKTLSLLPNKLKAEIALHVHLDTLKRVEIFQNTEAGFLCDLVLRLRPVLFSPGDFICRKGEVGKEMYIVNTGRLQVVADNGKTVLATLRPGSYFGEISILNMGNAGNRRTASVRSVGYSDLFCLSKNDLWDVLRDYPTARVRLEAIAIKRLEKYKKAPLEQDSTTGVRRSKSTPGLVESTGKVPLEIMLLRSFNYQLPPLTAVSSTSQRPSLAPAPAYEKSSVIDIEPVTAAEISDGPRSPRRRSSPSTQRESLGTDADRGVRRLSLVPPAAVNSDSRTSQGTFNVAGSRAGSRMVQSQSRTSNNATTITDKSPTGGSSSVDLAANSAGSVAATPAVSPVWTVVTDTDQREPTDDPVSALQQQQQHPSTTTFNYQPQYTPGGRSQSAIPQGRPMSTPSALMPEGGYCLQPSPLLAAPVPVYTGGGYSCFQPPTAAALTPAGAWPSPATPHHFDRRPSPTFQTIRQQPTPQPFYSPFALPISPAGVLHSHQPPPLTHVEQPYNMCTGQQPGASAVAFRSDPAAAANYHHPIIDPMTGLPSAGLLPGLGIGGFVGHAAAAAGYGMPPAAYHPGLAGSTSLLASLGLSPTGGQVLLGPPGLNPGYPLMPQASKLTAYAAPSNPHGMRERHSPEALINEITRLRSSLQTLESENASLTLQVNQQQRDADQRLQDSETVCQQQPISAAQSATTTTTRRDDVMCNNSDCGGSSSTGSSVRRNDDSSYSQQQSSPTVVDKESVI